LDDINSINHRLEDTAAASPSYGITSDPMAQLACHFAALIHDVDHFGVPNAQLVKEGTVLAARYQNKSVAEQNSFDITWRLFLSEDYSNVRRTICPTIDALQRFRQLVINCVMATDIMDSSLRERRKARFEQTFMDTTLSDQAEKSRLEQSAVVELGQSSDELNVKASLVMELLMQAADVAHTMQSWNTFREWNERLFAEVYKAFEEGRADTNPANSWYRGEMDFLDYYILPMIEKLRVCGVLSTERIDEYSRNATINRKEWEKRGEEIVDEMVRRYGCEQHRRVA
jgi:3'5'-cyclic nucleotide phosphodiesterase